MSEMSGMIGDDCFLDNGPGSPLIKPELDTSSGSSTAEIKQQERVAAEPSHGAFLSPNQPVTPEPSITSKKDSRRNSSRKTLLKVFNGKAPGKRQLEFNKIFSNDVPDEEPLIADFSCALVRDILVQGRLFLTPNYCCFHSTILRWETSAVIPFTDITNVSKEKTIKIIPNAISVECNQNKYIFTSFTARDRALFIFKKFWKLKHAESGMSQSANPVNIERLESTDSVDPEMHGNADMLNENEDEINTDRMSNTSNHSDEHEPVPVFAEPNGAKVFLDVVFPVPVDTLFSLLWLTESPFWSRFMNLRKTKNWFADEWQNQPDGKIIRECRCLQHIQLPMGAKDVPQVDNHVLLLSENSRRIVVDAKTYIREVPYGDNFYVLNRWQFLRADQSHCRVRVATSVCFEKACWQMVKSFIEKNAYDGNQEFLIGFRDELNRFIENGSVHPAPIQEGSETGGDVQNRHRSTSKISVKPSTENVDHNLNPRHSIASLSQIPESNHVPMQFPRGIDHFGAWRHWGFFLFFFFVGMLLFSNWSLHSRLSTVEANFGIQGNEPFLPKTGEPNQFKHTNTEDGMKEVAELLKLLVKEVRQIRNPTAAHPIDEL